MTEKYNLVFKGSIKNGADKQTVKDNLSKKLKLTEQQVNKLFSAKQVVIKKGVDKKLGVKYQKIFDQAGAALELKKIPIELSLEPQEEIKEPLTPQFTCPKCGCEQDNNKLCKTCRSDFKPSVAPQNKIREIASHFTEEKKEIIKESIVEEIKFWIKGNIIKAGILLLLLPLFGSKLVLSAVFFSEDKHLLYQTLGPTTLCVDVPKISISGMGKTWEHLLNANFFNEFSEEEQALNLKKWNDIVCTSEYKMEIGNIGSEAIQSTEIDFQLWHFIKGSKLPPVFIDTAVRDISASSSREQDPSFKKDKGKLTVTNLYPGTMVTVYFKGWIDGPQNKSDWSQMLVSINTDEGKVDEGSPSSTTFAKLLTIFF